MRKEIPEYEKLFEYRNEMKQQISDIIGISVRSDIYEHLIRLANEQAAPIQTATLNKFLPLP